MPSVEQARSWYDSGDPVHGFDHVLRVYRMARRLSEEEGADAEILAAAALLHDVSGAAPAARKDEPDERSNHEHASASFARELLLAEGWDEQRIEAVEHCIRAHRYRGEAEPRTLEAKILFDADKLDVVGAFGIARTLGYANQAGQPAYAPVSEQFQRTGELEDGEPHSAYHEYLYKLRNVRNRLYTDSARQLAEAREKLMHTFFEQLKQEAEMGT
ncbi:MAG: HD domain-containing protein [Anaerolineales bacterium]